MARRKRMDRDMARAVAYDRLVAKSLRNGDGMSSHYQKMSWALKEKVYRRREREAAAAKEKKLFERDVKKLGMGAALDAAKKRREEASE